MRRQLSVLPLMTVGRTGASLAVGRRVRTRARVIGMRLYVGTLRVEVEILDDRVVGLGVLLRPAFIAGAHDRR